MNKLEGMTAGYINSALYKMYGRESAAKLVNLTTISLEA